MNGEGWEGENIVKFIKYLTLGLMGYVEWMIDPMMPMKRQHS